MPDEREVLVVDDDGDMADIYRSILEMKGLRVSTELSGEAALKRLKTGARPDLILVDVRMPAMDGPEFVLELQKQLPLLAERVPIVFLTGMEDMPPGTVAKGYLHKSLDLDLFADQVLEFLKKYGA
jgi:CheY-like chemotaxis protein